MLSTLHYRADIDGLRAIAVVAMIIYHANTQWLPGGFAGIDIFFVITGFLTTNIINTEIQQHTFSFTQFYLHRIKRILPLFFTVIFTVLCIGYFLFSAHEYVDLAKSVRYSIGFLSNHYLAGEQDYFAQELWEMPLLHMWSLAVIAQYYFLWPTLLLFLSNTFPKLQIAVPAFMAISSFILGTYWAQNPEHTAHAYYLLPSRFGELMIGSLLALYGHSCKNKWESRYLFLLGLSLLILSFTLLNKNSLYPGYNAFWPCIGTALLIYSGTHPQLTMIHRTISFPAIAFIGLLSYSLYLWHWPIFAFARYFSSSTELSLPWILSCIIVTFILSYLSWRFIEKPARIKTLNFISGLNLFFIIPTLAVFFICFFIIHSHGYLLTNSTREFDDFDSDSLVCHENFKKSCLAGEINQTPRILIVGDSHTAHLTTFFDLLGQQQHWSADILSVDSCPALSQTKLSSIFNSKQRQRCSKLIHFIQSNLNRYDTVILSLRWDLHFGFNTIAGYKADPDFTNLLISEIDDLLIHNKQVVLVGQAPIYKKSVSRLYRTTGQDNSLDPSYIEANNILQRIDRQYDSVYYLDIAAIVSQWKNGINNGLPVYKDNNHLNVYGQKLLLENSDAFSWLKDLLTTQVSLKYCPLQIQ